METTWSKEFKSNAIFRLEENIRMVSIALSKIGDDEIWIQQNVSLNPIGNQLLHIIGNMTQYVISGLAGKPDNRNRDLEFSTEDGHSSDELLQQLLLTTQEAKNHISKATDAQLLQSYKVQGFDLSGIGLVLHAVEHFSYHTGQIATQVKLVIDEPLGFYAGLNLNTLNESVEDSKEDLQKAEEDRG